MLFRSKAATIYFAIVFAFGFVFGTIRVLWTVPRFGERVAELIETCFMLIAIVFGGLVIKRFYVARTFVAVGSGVVALGLLVLAELELVRFATTRVVSFPIHREARSCIRHGLSRDACRVRAYAVVRSSIDSLT